MKISVLVIFFSLEILARAEDKLFDVNLAKNAVAVLRVDEVESQSTNGLFIDYLVWPKQVIKNESGENLNRTFVVRLLKGKGRIPTGGCTIYIERYWATTKSFNKTKGFWVLVGGDATNGVSHVKSDYPL